MYCVFATITPKSHYYGSARDAIISILENTRKESGCIQFDVHTNTQQTQLFLYERWHDEAALQLHYQQPYTKKVFAAYDEWLSIPVEIVTMGSLKP